MLRRLNNRFFGNAGSRVALTRSKCGRLKDYGYTLLETVISLAILTAVVIPLFGIFTPSNTIVDAHRELTGIWLVERESVIVRTFPHEILPVKRKYINDREWTIHTEASETQPKQYRITAEIRGKIKAEARFYGRTGGE